VEELKSSLAAQFKQACASTLLQVMKYQAEDTANYYSFGSRQLHVLMVGSTDLRRETTLYTTQTGESRHVDSETAADRKNE